jgi:hypothetical protein
MFGGIFPGLDIIIIINYNITRYFFEGNLRFPSDPSLAGKPRFPPHPLPFNEGFKRMGS